MVFDWDQAYYTTQANQGNYTKAFVSLRENATSFKANQCVFRDLGHTDNTDGTLEAKDGAQSAIVCRSGDLTEFTMTSCEFQNTNKSGGNGSAIYLMAKVEDDDAENKEYYDYTVVHNFSLTNCTFSNCASGGRGGAVSIQSFVHNGSISGCTFTGCTAGTYGGGVELSGNTGSFTVSGTTFTDCTSGQRGGGFAILSNGITNNKGVSRWTRSNDITFSGCTFTNCDATKNHGGGIGAQAQIHTLTVSDCDFENCDTGINGGGISIDGADLPDTFKDTSVTNYPDWCSGIDSCTTCSANGYALGTVMSGSYDWKGNLDATKTVMNKSWVNTVNITDGCTFTNCTAASNGGSIEFAEGCYVTNKATISGATISESKAVNEGSAVFWSTCFVKAMSLEDCIFQDCTFTGTSTYAGGTVKVTGKTTIVLDVQRCQFLRNYSHHHGGGLYWNANRTLDGLVCSATVNDCLFDGNEAAVHGGGIYVESKITITKCHIKNNKATYGGGIAQQVYNNPGAYMLEAGGVSELKLDPTTWVHHNEATYGGGISIRANETDSITDGSPIAYTVKFELNGAAVYENKATQHGGGIYFIAESFEDDADKQAEVDIYTKEIYINAGTGTAAAVYKNTASGNGGGIYMESSQNTKLYVQGGYISTNTGSSGGGIYMTGENATCYVQGGVIGGEGNDSNGVPLANVAQEAADSTGGCGGGIAISGGASIVMTGGEISYNKTVSNGTDGNHLQGGGIWLDNKASGKPANTMTLSGGTVKYNSTPGGTACDGGGIFVGTSGQFTMDNGYVQYNTSGTGWGGGVYVANNAAATINDGDVSFNTAGNGAGFFARSGSTVNINGGDIHENSSSGNGGGITVYYGNATINMAGGTIRKNTAAGNGGGIYAQYATATISGGDITENTAANDGGGIYASAYNTNGANVTINGGSIFKNTATSGYGGGVYAEGTNTAVTLSGGSVYENTAAEAGGGISLKTGATATVKNDTDTSTVGQITKNTAARGGGVSVESGAELTVTNGFITYNKAVGTCSNTTALEHNTSLKGTGGGIYVAEGDSDEDPAKFTLSGDHIAIYGNLADFAADDVFASGEYTVLDVPQKKEMHLEGYEFSPEGWFEDYAKDDSAYTSGLNLAAAGSGITDNNVFRYRAASQMNRVLIPDDVVDSDGDDSTKNVNDPNVYVCMTLGIPAAIDDTVVIDYGLPVDIDVLANEQMKIGTPTLVAIGAAREDKEGVDFSETNELTAEPDLSFGTAEIDAANGIVRYTPNQMGIDQTERFSYAVKYCNDDTNTYYYYAHVTVIPATTIYYEDNFVSYTVWNVSDDSLNTAQEHQWTSVGDTESATQEQDRPGNDWAETLDADNLYGSDGAYTDMATYSMGSAMKVTANNQVYGEAQFTFRGTGFDVISLTSGTTGTITVDVYKTEDFKTSEGDDYTASAVESHMVDTFYGYKHVLCNVVYEWDVTPDYPDGHWVQLVEGENTAATEESPVDLTKYADPKDGDKTETGVEYVWLVDTASSDTLYQVPVMKVSGLDYGQYTAVVTVYYKSALDHQDKGSYDFYLDAIRIYDPANDGDGNQVIEDAYVADGEGWPEYFELRNLIISKNDFDALTDGAQTSGVIFIDDAGDAEGYSISDYTNFGPNNELYLAPGQSIAFELNVSDPTQVAGDECDVAGIHLAMKSVGNTAANVEYYNAAMNGSTVIMTNRQTLEVSTATDLYYDITNLNGKTVVIKNVSGAILSITNVKVTYTGEHEDGIEASYFSSSQVTADVALLSLRPVAPEEPEVPEETVPETTVPEETVPETTVPEETTPETTVPEETVPETTVPGEDEAEAFEPEKFQVRLSDSSVKVGSKVTVTVTTGTDVDYITINGTVVTNYTVSRFSNTRTWRVRVEAKEAGEQDVTVVCYNADDLASLPITRTFTVTEQYTSFTDELRDLIIGFFDRLWGGR